MLIGLKVCECVRNVGGGGGFVFKECGTFVVPFNGMDLMNFIGTCFLCEIYLLTSEL